MNVFEKQKLAQQNQIFDYYPPKKKYIGAVSIPHSGEVIPEEFKEYLIDDIKALCQDVDTAVHKLIDIEQLNDVGIAVIKANIHRVCVDLNRPKETAALNWQKNSHGIEIVKIRQAFTILRKTPLVKFKSSSTEQSILDLDQGRTLNFTCSM